MFCVAFLLLTASVNSSAPVNVQEIVAKSVEANARDFAAAPHYSYQERDRTPKGSKTFQVTMIEGSPYNELIAVNGQPLTGEAKQQEMQKKQHTVQERSKESPDQRRHRIAKYEKDRHRDNSMMDQLTKAFDFTLVGEPQLNSHSVYALRARPRKGYQPPNMETEVLPCMQGMLWIDKKTFQWVKVTAVVTRPASIEGFLAKVSPGTRFELEKGPVADGVWLPTHFSMRSKAKVLYMFNDNSQEDDSFSNYQPVSDTPAHGTW